MTFMDKHEFSPSPHDHYYLQLCDFHQNSKFNPNPKLGIENNQRLSILNHLHSSGLRQGLAAFSFQRSRKTILLLSPYLFFGRSQGGAIRTQNICSCLRQHYNLITLELCPHFISRDPYKISLIDDDWIHVKCLHAVFPAGHHSKIDHHYAGYLTPELSALLSLVIQRYRPDLFWAEFSYMGMYEWIATMHGIPSLLSMHNVEWMILRELQIGAAVEARSVHGDWRYMRLIEEKIISQFSNILVTTDQDMVRAAAVNPDALISVAPNVISRDQDSATLPALFLAGMNSNEPLNISFVGDCSYLPNSLGVQWFHDQVYIPNLSKLSALVAVNIYGKGSELLMPTYDEQGAVHYLGYASDLDEVYSQANAMLIPLLHGGGSRLKAFEAIYRRKPILSTAKGIEGVSLDGLDDYVYIFDSSDTFLAAILRLKTRLENPGYVEGLTDAYASVYSKWISEFDAAVLCAAESSMRAIHE